MNKVKIIDNFLKDEHWEKIFQTMNSNFFPWYLVKYIDNDLKNKSVLDKENFMFTHLFYDNYEFKSDAYFIHTLIKKIDPASIIRIRANLTFPINEQKKLGFHIDDYFIGKTAVYYLNNNNGKTVFKNGEIIDSVANRIIIFDSNIEHSPVFSTDEKRMLINFNYTEKTK